MVTSEDGDQPGDLSASVDTLEMSSWEKCHDVYGAPINVPVTPENYRLPGGSVRANLNDIFQQFFRRD